MKQDTNSIKYKVLASLYNSSTYLHLRGSFWIQHWPLLGRSLGARHYQSHLWRIAALAVCTQWRGCRLSFGTCCPRDMLPYSGKGWRHSVQNSKNEAFIMMRLLRCDVWEIFLIQKGAWNSDKTVIQQVQKSLQSSSTTCTHDGANKSAKKARASP